MSTGRYKCRHFLCAGYKSLFHVSGSHALAQVSVFGFTVMRGSPLAIKSLVIFNFSAGVVNSQLYVMTQPLLLGHIFVVEFL